MRIQLGVAALVAGVGLFVTVVVVVVVVVRAEPAEERPSVRYLAVDAHPGAAHTGGHDLAVTIELETTSRMPHVAPHIKIVARCGDATDKGQAFLHGSVQRQARRSQGGHVRLFEIRSFAAPPASCELTLSLSEGATPPQRYCFQGGPHAARRVSVTGRAPPRCSRRLRDRRGLSNAGQRGLFLSGFRTRLPVVWVGMACAFDGEVRAALQGRTAGRWPRRPSGGCLHTTSRMSRVS